MRENRETSATSRCNRERSEKALSRTADVYVAEESDQAIVPTNRPNKRDGVPGGGWGGKGLARGERREVRHEPDTERDHSRHTGQSPYEGLAPS